MRYMIGILCMLCMLASLPVAAAPALSVSMNGEYRCDNGKTFTVKVRSAPIMNGDLIFQAGMEPTNNAGTVHPTMKHEVDTLELYGAGVLLDGKHYKLRLQDGDKLMLQDQRKKLRWAIHSDTAPFSGSLSSNDGLVGNNCIHTESIQIN